MNELLVHSGITISPPLSLINKENMSRILGLDVGEKNIGIAVSDEMAIIATPLKAVKSENALEEILQIVTENEIETIVAGIPRDMNGELNEKAEFILEFVKKLKEKVQKGVKIELEDESGTSLIAEKRLKERGVETRNKKEEIDKEAAAVILESFLRR